MESFEVAEQIQLCQRKLLEALGELDKEVKSKRHSTAIAILDRLRGEMTDAMYEKKIAVGVIKDIIKKSTHEELKAVVQVEDDLTLIRSRIEVYKAVLNGWQSVNRYLSDLPENQ
jgi:hypothetical protein